MNTLNATVQHGSHSKPDSTWKPRVSAIQKEAIVRALTGKQFTPEQTDELNRYVATGDLSAVSTDLHHLLTTTVTQARASLNASQAKRIWPRKVASVALHG